MTNQSLADYVHDQSSDPDWDEEAFRANVRSALEQGNFILTIAVNEINEELNRIVRYVNSAGTPAFSFAALEMRRFHKSKFEMLIPHVFGPVHTPTTKPKPATRRWDEPSFFEALHLENPTTEAIARRILDWARTHKTRITWGEGTRYGSFVPLYNYGGQERPLFAVWTYGSVEVYFYWYQYRPPFDREEKRLEILNKLNEIEGVSLPLDAINKRPSIKLSTFAVPGTLEKFFAVFEWMLEEINKS
jgi:hypothetical protein